MYKDACVYLNISANHFDNKIRMYTLCNVTKIVSEWTL